MNTQFPGYTRQRAYERLASWNLVAKGLFEYPHDDLSIVQTGHEWPNEGDVGVPLTFVSRGPGGCGTYAFAVLHFENGVVSRVSTRTWTSACL